MSSVALRSNFGFVPDVEPFDPAGLPDRLYRLRRAMGFRTQSAFAEFLGVGIGRYNNVERGAYPLSRLLEEAIIRKCAGVTADWLRRGVATGLPVGLAQRLGELPSPNKQQSN